MKIVRKDLAPHTLRLVAITAIVATVGSVASLVIGCGDDNNRVPTKAEVQKADVNRQAEIDKLDIPEAQKAIMKSHMGGASVPNPAMAAQQTAQQNSQQKDRR